MAVLAGLLGCAVLTTALTAALTVTTPFPDEPAAAAGPSDSRMRVLQMNLCDSGWASCYTGRAVATAAALIRAEAPDLVTLNEICQDDVPVLAGALAAADHVATTTSAFRSAMDRRTGGPMRCRNGQPYGIGLLARRSRVATGFAPTSGVYPVQDRSDPEERAWLCQDAVTVTACTTHLANSSATVARAQCDYLMTNVIPAVLALGAPAPTVLGGDFNLVPGGSPDLRSCLPARHRRADDGGVQNVVVTSDIDITGRRSIDLHGTTDHPALLVTLASTAVPAGPSTGTPPTAASRAGAAVGIAARCPFGRPCMLAAWHLSS